MPVFNEAQSLPFLIESIESVFQGLPNYDWEVVFVNDGSSDNSWEVICGLSRNNVKISGLCLSRNFGKELALTAGLESVDSADAIIFMDADLQHPPEMIPTYIKEWEAGAEIVVGIRKKVSDHSFAKKMGSKIFYSLMRRLSDVDIPPNSTDFRLLDKKVVEALCQFSERTRMFRGLIDWLGFRKSYVEFVADERQNGHPTYSYRKLFELAINSITSFSLLPLRFTGYLGLLVCFVAGLLIIYMLITDFLNLQVYTPQAYFVVFNTILTGITLSALGMIALYIGHIHTEVVGRPLYIVRERTGHSKKQQAVPDLKVYD